MAVDAARSVPVSRTPSLAFSPALALVGIVVCSTVARTLAAFERATPRYFPDEFLYSQLARSLAEDGRPRVLGQPVGLPALLEPLLSAWTWLPGDPELAFRLTQAQHALVVSLASVPVYALARQVGAGARLALAAAALAVASPGFLYAGYLTADAIGYTACLGAVWAGVRMLSAPGRRAELLFCTAAGVAAFARLQYAVLVLAAAVAAPVVERSALRAARTFPVVYCSTFLALVAAAAAVASTRYSAVADFELSGRTGIWLASSAFLLCVAAGPALVPGALAGAVAELLRPTDRNRLAFAALSLTLVASLLGVSAVMAVETGSERFFERYLLVATPLCALLFAGWLSGPRRSLRAVVALSAALATTAAVVPLSSYAADQGKADSPLLLALWQLESNAGVGAASLVAALGISVGAGVACLAALRPSGGGVAAIAWTSVSFAVVSAAAHAADVELSARVRATDLPPVPGWIDVAARGRAVLALQTAGSDASVLTSQLLWNTSVHRLALLGDRTSGLDGAAGRVTIGSGGVLGLGGEPISGLALLARNGSRVVPAAARAVARTSDFELVEWTGSARAAAVVEGLRADGWLSARAAVTVYPSAAGRCRALTLGLSLPEGSGAGTVVVASRGRERRIALREGYVASVRVDAGPRAARTLSIEALSPRFRPGELASVGALVTSLEVSDKARTASCR